MFKQISYITSLQLLEKLLLFSVIPLIVNKLSVPDYGIYNLVITSGSLLFILIHLYFHEYLNNFLTGLQIEKIKNFFFKFFILTNISFIVIFSLSICLKFFVFNELNKYDLDFKILISILVLSYVDAAIKILSSFFRVQMKIVLSNLLLNLFSISKILLIFFFVIYFKKIENILLFSSLLFLTLYILFSLFVIIRYDFYKINIHLFSVDYRKVFKFCFPLVILAIFLWFNNFGDRFVFIYLVDFNFYSEFSLFYSIGTIGYFVPFILNLVYHPIIQKEQNINQGKNIKIIFSNIYKYSLFFFILFIFFFNFLGDWIFSRLFPELYSKTFLQNFYIITYGLFFYGLFESTYILYFIRSKNFILMKLSIIISMGYFLAICISYLLFKEVFAYSLFMIMKFLTLVASIYLNKKYFSFSDINFYQFLILMVMFLIIILDLNNFFLLFLSFSYLIILINYRHNFFYSK